MAQTATINNIRVLQKDNQEKSTSKYDPVPLRLHVSLRRRDAQDTYDGKR